MGENRSAIGTRPFLAIILAVVVLFASGLTGAAVASAATMNHDMQMMETGHCSSMPSKDDGKAPVKSCCIATCAATAAVVPSIPAELALLQQASATFPIPAAHDGYLGEIATPPPRHA